MQITPSAMLRNSLADEHDTQLIVQWDCVCIDMGWLDPVTGNVHGPLLAWLIAGDAVAKCRTLISACRPRTVGESHAFDQNWQLDDNRRESSTVTEVLH